MPREVAKGVLSWASEIDDVTVEQAARTARLPIIEGHIALMADAHLGMGATIGSVIPTRDAVIPSAVGVDIGCGMVAAETVLTSHDLPDDLHPLLNRIERRIPAGMGQQHRSGAAGLAHGYGEFSTLLQQMGRRPATGLDPKQQKTAAQQFGTLGSGNHFLEVCLDERDRVWVVLHSGSRGIGNQLAQRHIARAKELHRQQGTPLEDPDLAWFVQGTPAFEAYLADLLWAQEYAFGNREQMVRAALELLAIETDRESGEDLLDRGQRDDPVVNCHHNYTAQEEHGGRTLWITRKGAIRARRGDRGVVPGSMGTGTYVVRGLGEPRSYTSSAHGAGRRLSRRAARRAFTEDDLLTAMTGRAWLRHKGKALLDEIPHAYKDVEQVMRDQADLVQVDHVLRSVLNYKGT